MKKYNFYLWLTVLVGLLASCSQDEAAGPQTNTESNRVTLTASLPDNFAQIGTRAKPDIPSGLNLRCILEVWTQGDNPALKIRQEKEFRTSENMNIVFDFTLDEGTYDCLFWADYILTGTIPSNVTIGDVTFEHYLDQYYITTDATNGLKAITLDETKYNEGLYDTYDKRDAFFGHYELQKEAAAVENPTIDPLTRALAKLTIKEKNATNYAACKKLTVAYAVPKGFNVLTGTASTIPYNVEATFSKYYGSSDILFNDFIFTDASSTLGEIKLSFTGTDKNFLPVTIPAGIPLKRNYKTNASGNLISEKPAPTPGVKLTVEVNADWAGTQDTETDPTIWDGNYPTSVDEAKAWMGEETAGANDPTAVNHVFTIKAARQLAALHYLMVNKVKLNGAVGTDDGHNGTEGDGYGDATYNLAADIDLNNKPWIAIGSRQGGNEMFTGTFNGQGHTVSGMNAVKETAQPRVAFISGFEGTLKHLNVKGVLNVKQDASPGACGGIVGFHSGGTIAFCSFQGTITAAGTKEDSSIGGISGYFSFMGGNAQIISCYSVLSSVEVGSNVTRKGGIAGYMGDSGTIKGCYWQTLSGLDGTNPYGEKEVDIIETIEDCGTFTNAAGANAVINTMNKYDTDYDYHWQAATDGGYPVLVKKQP